MSDVDTYSVIEVRSGPYELVARITSPLNWPMTMRDWDEWARRRLSWRDAIVARQDGMGWYLDQLGDA